MSNIVLYDPDSTVVAYRVTDYLLSANTPDYTSNALINPDVSGLSGVANKYWVVDGTNVGEMNASDKTSVDNFLKAKTIREKVYKVMKYCCNNQLQTETWYDTDIGDGTYSGKAEETVFTFDTIKNLLVSKTVSVYYFDGTLESAITTKFYQTDHEIIEKTE